MNAVNALSAKAYLKYLAVKETLRSKRGDFVQQALLWTLIAIAGIAALTVMGGAIRDKFIQLSDTFSNTNP